MKISRNAPCPCGSGKKYKRCCGADGQPFNGVAQNDPWAEQVAQAIEDSGASTMEEMDAIVEQMSIERNDRPIRGFLGLSPTQMSEFLYHPLESPQLVSFNEKWVPENSLPLQIFVALAVGISKEGVRATQKGNLPIQLCRDILASIPEDKISLRPSRITTEDRFPELYTLRALGQMVGLIKKYKSRIMLTKLGHKLMQPDRKAELFHTLFKAYVKKYNWGYRDRYPDVNIIQTGWLFSLYCLSLYGSQWRPSHFYSDKFLEAFPMALEEFDERPYSTIKQQFYSCYEIRTLVRFAHFWGIVDVREHKVPNSISFEYDIKAPHIKNLLQFNVK